MFMKTPIINDSVIDDVVLDYSVIGDLISNDY